MNNFILKSKSIKIRTILNNTLSFLKRDLKKELIYSEQEIRNIKEKLNNLENDLLFLKIINYYNEPSLRFKEEISYLKELGKITVFPYKQKKNIDIVIAKFDDKKEMPYVLHNNKRLYFPKSWSVEEARDKYIDFVENENILGGDYSEKSPHQYQTQKFCVKEGDVVLDIGAAEALFSLDIIDIAKKIYIFESEKIWIEPLNCTFEPYQDKVIIINKLVSNINSENEVKLENCVQLDDVESLFIKMDIEGYEKFVIEDNLTLFSKNIDIKIACCTYHKQEDANNFKTLFNNLGFKTEFSDGFILFIYDNDLKPPYFRHGIIRAEKLKKN